MSINLTGVLSQLGNLAGSIATSIIPGASALPDLIKAGQAVADAFTTVKDANGGEAPADAEEKHQQLLDKVRAHAEGTLGRLEGD